MFVILLLLSFYHLVTSSLISFSHIESSNVVQLSMFLNHLICRSPNFERYRYASLCMEIKAYFISNTFTLEFGSRCYNCPA